jgi:hypothetical protein
MLMGLSSLCAGGAKRNSSVEALPRNVSISLPSVVAGHTSAVWADRNAKRFVFVPWASGFGKPVAAGTLDDAPGGARSG